jgi:hypothetical protein
MTKSTSIEAYHQGREDGLLSRVRQEVLNVIVENQDLPKFSRIGWGIEGPGSNTSELAWLRMNGVSQKDVAKILKTLDEDGERTSGPRFAELIRMDAIKIIGKAPCFETGKAVQIYRSTGRVRPLQRLITHREALERFINDAERILARPPTSNPFELGVCLHEIEIAVHRAKSRIGS